MGYQPLRLLALLFSIILFTNLIVFLQNNSQESKWTERFTYQKYPQSLQQSILQTDNKLGQLARAFSDGSFIHPNAVPSEQMHPSGVKMNSITQLASVSQLQLDPSSPRGGGLGEHMLVLVLVYTMPIDYERRQAIRETFGSALKRNPQSDLLFVLARDDQFQEQINGESQKYNDILQFNFTESYYNLTLKSIAVLRWTALHCPHVKYIFKLDSDCFVRVNPLLDALKAQDGHSILGLYRDHEPVLRNSGTKWDISPLYYPYTHYPPYIAGPYLIPGYAASQLYGAITRHPTKDTIPALPFDDAYITGILAEKANVTRTSWNGIQQLWSAQEAASILPSDEHSVFYEQLNSGDLKRLWTLFGED